MRDGWRKGNPILQGWTLHRLAKMHLPVCAEIHAHCFERPWDIASLERSLALPGSFGHVLCCEQDPGGFALYQIAGEVCEVFTLAVLPALRRKGAGANLMRAAEALLAAHPQVEKWVLEVASDNVGAQALYAAMGFKKWGERKNYYDRLNKNPVDALVLGKYLVKKS